MNISSIDLNLFVNLFAVFDAVCRARNASLAAEQPGLSQPAVSNALQRLLGQFNDRLFSAPDGSAGSPGR